MKLKKTMLVLSLILCILFSISCVVASDVNDTPMASDANNMELATNDENQVIKQSDDDLITASDAGTFTELQARILLTPSGDTLELDKDYSFNVNSTLDNGIIIYKNLTIDGKGHSIDGMSKSRIFRIIYNNDNDHVILKNIVFKNGFANIYGGAILNFGELTIDNCTFINNYANTAGGAINSLGSLNLKNSKFDKNVAGGDAGAVFSLNVYFSGIFDSSTTDLNSTNELSLMLSILTNTTLNHGKDYISDCIFTNNVANGNGGGAVYAFSNMDINYCTFNSNRAGEKGAAVFGNKDLYIKNSNFNKNKVGLYGGAVYFKCHEQSGHYENGTWVSSIKFYSNSIENSVFADNVAGERGGAIYGFKAVSYDNVHCAHAIKCTFSDNKAPNGKDVYGGTVSNCVYKNTRIGLKTVAVKKSAKKLVLTAALKKGSTPLKYKQVIFKFNGKTYRGKTNSKGIAKYTIKKNVLNKLKVGKKVVYQVSYGSFIAKKVTKVRR